MKKGRFLCQVICCCLAAGATTLLADPGERSADHSRTARRGAPDTDRTTIHPVVVRPPLQWRNAVDSSSARRAESYMGQARMTDSDAAAISALLLAAQLGGDDEKLLAEAYARLGDRYEGAPAKQVRFYALALRYTADPGIRAHLQRRISELGGDVYTLALRPGGNTTGEARSAGPDDSCNGAVSMTLPWIEQMSIAPAGDHNWRSFDVPGPDGVAVRIETISPNPPYVDDTDLVLWSGCDAGIPGDVILLDDDGGEGFMSLIQTECLAPGTYYVQVGGFLDTTEVPDFDLDVQVTEVCILPGVDPYEPDDEMETATPIGLPSSLPAHANGWGRSRREIQQHTIYPSGDWDHVRFDLTGSEMVRIGTAFEFPTFFNDFASEPIGHEADTYVELHYGEEPDYGGFCNDPASGFMPACREDEDCPSPAGAPLPGYPTCIPIEEMIFYFGPPPFWPDSPLAFNEDRAPYDWGSELKVCLPRADANTPSLTAAGGWIVRALSSPVWAPMDTFAYQLQVKNEHPCNFEREPNNGPDGANPMTLGETYHGFQEYSAFFATGEGNNPGGSSWFRSDPDWFSFDTPSGEQTHVVFETDGYDSYYCDTYLRLYVGPDDDGAYHDTGIGDEDSGPGWLSRLELVVPSADELLGNTIADASYFLDVTSWWINNNYPWELRTSATPYVPPLTETEPNDTCARANDLPRHGKIVGSIDPACDFDSFNLTLIESRFIAFETFGPIADTTMHLENSAGEYLGCDDDGGLAQHARIEGCLPPDDYCVRVRAHSGYATIPEYELHVVDAGPCVPTNPPTTWYGEYYGCDGAGFSSPTEEFNTCP
jgi:hypothetical protein